MKIFNVLTSRIVLVFLAIIVEIAAIALVCVTFSAYYLAIRIASIVLGIFAFLYLASKTQAAEFKIPWLLGFVIFPLVFVVLYVMFTAKKISEKTAEG